MKLSNIIGIALILVALVGFSTASPILEQTARSIEDINYRLECDKDHYYCIQGDCPAYCNITINKELNMNDIDIEAWLQHGSNISIKNITVLKVHNTKEKIDVLSIEKTKSYEKIRLKASKENIIELMIMLNTDQIMASDELWLSIQSDNKILTNDRLELDPPVSGLSENATHVYATSGTYSGNTITTTKNVSLSSVTINGNGANCYSGEVTITSGASIYLDFVTINGYGGNSDGSCACGTGQVNIYANEENGNVTISRATLRGYGGNAGAGAGTSNTAGCSGTANIYGWDVYIDKVNINAYGGYGRTLNDALNSHGGSSSCTIIGNSSVYIYTDSSTYNFGCYGGKGGDET